MAVTSQCKRKFAWRATPCVLIAASMLMPAAALTDENESYGMSRVDHLVYAAPDLDAAIAYVEELLGIRATVGGSHPGGGTRNALLALGPSTYLEIIAPDPAQTDIAGERIFRIDRLGQPTLVTWAANSDDVDRIAAIDIGSGATPGASLAGSRRRPDGVLLAWQYTDPAVVRYDGIVPFFIDWGDTPHPAASAPAGARLVALRAEHPDPDGVRRAFAALGLDLAVAAGDTAALIATIESPRGTVELR